MEPFGAGAPEIRLYRRPYYGAALVELAALGPVAEPRLFEVISDPGEEVYGEPSRRPGLYLALVEGGAVVDVARLASYAGQAAGAEDLEEDYFLNGSDTSDDPWQGGSGSSGTSEKQHGKSNSRGGSRDGKNSSGGGSIDGKSSSGCGSRDGKSISGGGSRGSRDGKSSSEDQNDRSSRSRSRSSSCEEQSGDSQMSNREEQSGDRSSQTSSRASTSNEDQDAEESSGGTSGNSSSEDQDAEESSGGTSSNSSSEDQDVEESRGGTSCNSSNEDQDAEESSGGTSCNSSIASTSSEDQDVESSSGTSGNRSSASTSSEDQDAESSSGTSGNSQDLTSSDEMKVDQQEGSLSDHDLSPMGDLKLTSSTEESNDDETCAKILEVEGKEEEEEDVSKEEEQCRSVNLKLRIWPWQKHTSIKIFCGQKWIASKVYRLTWINHEELEELFESSFKLDICAPISAYTVFRIRHCTMDFEAFMLDSPCFNELIDEFKSSVRDFRFCKKLGGEDVCRVFKCLWQGSVFALKTVRLEESCSMEPREVEIIASLKDKRVMAFYQAWIEPWSYKNRPISNHLFIQLELCQSTLNDKLSLGNLESIVDRWYLFEEMAKGVKAIHDESIVHRDLKPDNVFLGSDMGVRIGDFGDACMGYDEFGGYGGTPSLGTPLYSAPELKSAQKISQKADIYSMGAMALALFTKFETGSEKFELLREVRDEGLPDDWVGDPDLVGDREGLRELVERMTTTEPAYRPSAAEVLVYLQNHDDLEEL